jgi:hypothetical protein
LATLPEHRPGGVAGHQIGGGVPVLGQCGDDRDACRASQPDRHLVATEAGVPLYTSLGFAAVSTAIWYRQTT